MKHREDVLVYIFPISVGFLRVPVVGAGGALATLWVSEAHMTRTLQHSFAYPLKPS